MQTSLVARSHILGLVTSFWLQFYYKLVCVALHSEGHSHREAKRKLKCYSGTLTETVWSRIRVGSWPSLVLRLPNLRRPRRYREREAQDGRTGRAGAATSHLILPPRPAAHHGPAATAAFCTTACAFYREKKLVQIGCKPECL